MKKYAKAECKKVICSNCEAKFYDLNRKPVTCPVCGTEQADPSMTISVYKYKACVHR